jgi:hypothetical protein
METNDKLEASTSIPQRLYHLERSNESMKPTQHIVVSSRSMRRQIGKVAGWRISLTHDLPNSFAPAGYPVHLADSQSARFSLGYSTGRKRADQ